MDFGRMIWSRTTLDYAVEAAARCAAIDPLECGGAPAIESFAASAAAGLPVSPANFSVAAATCGLDVTGRMEFAFAVPALFPFSVTLTAEACYPS